jgi:hypothetical protein
MVNMPNNMPWLTNLLKKVKTVALDRCQSKGENRAFLSTSSGIFFAQKGE